MSGFLEWAHQKKSSFLIDILRLSVVFVLVDFKKDRLVTFLAKILMPNFLSQEGNAVRKASRHYKI